MSLGELPALDGFSPTSQALLKLSYIEARTQYQRELVGAYGRSVIELARCVMELDKLSKRHAYGICRQTAATLARYASEIADIACEHVAMSAEIHREPSS
jgi:hypothetical protein